MSGDGKYRHQLTDHAEKEASVVVVTVLSSKRQFGTGNWVLASRVDHNASARIKFLTYRKNVL